MKRKKLCLIIVIGIYIILSLGAKNYDFATLVFIREEANGVMNSLYCDIQIEKEVDGKFKKYNDFIISEFQILDHFYDYDKNELSLAGGERLVLSIQPGKYRLRCFTPRLKQNGYLQGNTDWESEYLIIKIESNKKISIVINPTVDNEGYSGNWEINEKK